MGMRTPTMEDYIASRLGLEKNAGFILLKKVFTKPLKAKSIREFWYYWNPFYTYILTFYIYKPCKKILPKGLSMIVTFFFCGYVLHDVINMLFNAPGTGFYVPFPNSGILYVLFALITLSSDALGIKFDKVAPALRPFIHIGVLALTFVVSCLIGDFIYKIIS